MLDEQGKPDFNRLQNLRHGDAVYFYAFDLLMLRGKRLIREPLVQRRELLADVMKSVRDPIRLSQTFNVSAAEMIAMVRQHNLEGIVAKRVDSPYEPGRRSDCWLKFKTYEREVFVWLCVRHQVNARSRERVPKLTMLKRSEQ